MLDMTDYTQDMKGDPAVWYENRQNYELSLACKPCQFHRYDEFSVRYCAMKKTLRGNDLSICGEFRPRDLRDPKSRLISVFKEQK